MEREKTPHAAPQCWIKALRWYSLLYSSVNLCLPLTSVNISTIRNQFCCHFLKICGFNFGILLLFIVRLSHVRDLQDSNSSCVIISLKHLCVLVLQTVC